jgi:hypothetical protein
MAKSSKAGQPEKNIEPMVVEFRHTSLSAGCSKLFSTRTANTRPVPRAHELELEHELGLGLGLGLAPAHELGVTRKCD